MASGGNVKQKNSILLKKHENDQIFNLLDQKCETLSTTVVKLFCTEGPDEIHWKKKDQGVLCLVRDINRRSYFFQLFCMLRNRMIWEHEIYNRMQYLAPKPFLHAFEKEGRIVAFDFASEDEATHMRRILLEILKNEEQKRSSKKTKKESIIKAGVGKPQNFRHVSHVGWNPTTGFDLENADQTMRTFLEKARISENDLKDKKTRKFIYDFIEKHGGLDAVKQDVHQSVLPPPSPPPPPVPSRNKSLYSNSSLTPPPPLPRKTSAEHPAPLQSPSDLPPINVKIQKSHDSLKESKRTKKKCVTKADIGNPQNLIHVSHVGWDQTTGFDLENADKIMRKFLKKARVSENDLKDKETRDFIYDFIKTHGGLEAVKQDVHHQSILPTPVPLKNLPKSSNFRPTSPPQSSRNARF